MSEPESAWENVHKARRYNGHPSGIETKHVIRLLDFNRGSIFKYVVRREGKEHLRSLQSALFYLEDFWEYGEYPYTRYEVQKKLEAMVEAHATADQRPLDKQFYWAFLSLVKDPGDPRSYERVKASLLALIEAAPKT